MAALLHIDTAVDTASVCLTRENGLLQLATNSHQKDHASWLHPAIQQIMAGAGVQMHDLEAVAITIGPGSYTGLRVGLAAAKGLCFGLGIPLIAVNTLEMMAQATRDETGDLLCPLIDARRMEVFMAVYDKNMEPVVPPAAMIVRADSFDRLLASHKIIFSGNGSGKIKQFIDHPNAVFSTRTATAADLVALSEKHFREKRFADIAYTEPVYLKEFYSVAR